MDPERVRVFAQCMKISWDEKKIRHFVVSLLEVLFSCMS